MPSKTRAQHNLMQMCSSDEGRAKARVKCPPKSVAREFTRADQKRRGEPDHTKRNPSRDDGFKFREGY